MAQTVDRLERSLQRDPRLVDLLYLNPLCLETFTERGWRVISDTGSGTTRWLRLQPPPSLCERLKLPSPDAHR